MKIAYLINCYPQASHSFIRREIAALESQGIQIERISIRRPVTLVDPADQAELGKTFIIFNHLFRASCLAIFWMVRHPLKTWQGKWMAMRVAYRGGGWIKQLLYFIEGLALANWLTKWGISHVHAHFGTNSAAVAMYSHLSGGPGYSMTVHGPEEFDAPQKLALGEKIHSAKFVAAISEFGRSQLFRWCPMADWEKIQVIHCGLDDQFLRLQSSSIPDVPRLVCVGRLCEQKGQLLLLCAAAIIIKEGLPLELLLVGDGPMRSEIEALIAELRLETHVKITGWQTNEQVRHHILSSRATILPSFAEGLPVVIMESLALHRPVISTYVAGIPELVEHRVNGWLVPAGSVNELKKSMVEALRLPTERIVEMGAAGARRVAEFHDAMIEARKLVSLFGREILSGSVEMPLATTVESI